MSHIAPDEIRRGQEYEAARAESRREVAEVKRHRRVAVGDTLALVFENRETIRSVIEEVVRAERLSDAAQVERQVEAFNAVVPVEGELEATLYVEVPDPAELGLRLEELAGVQEAVYLEIAGRRVSGRPRAVAVADEPPAAFYISFALDPELREAWLSGAPVAACVEHAAVRARTELDDDQRTALASDLRA